MNDPAYPTDPCFESRAAAPRRSKRLALLCALLLALGGCGHVSVPKVSMPTLGGDEADEKAAQPIVDATATPRDLLGARLVNPKSNPDTPSMTVGKMIEFADRYLACDCANTRFVRSWEKTDEGYKVLTNSGVVRPLEFKCKEVGDGRECYLTEIDRGPQSASFEERFVPGSNFIQFLYEHGVQCDREEPCPVPAAETK